MWIEYLFLETKALYFVKVRCSSVWNYSICGDTNYGFFCRILSLIKG